MAVGIASTDFDVVRGVRLAAINCGLKTADDDLVLMELAEGSSVAGVFTKSWFSAAPVLVCKQHLSQGIPRLLLINSGNANAAVGDTGIADALACCESLAQLTGVKQEEILPFSTGVIGQRLEVQKIQSRLGDLASRLHESNWLDAAKGIMTTDTRPKIASRKKVIAGREVTITGIAKGSGMIQPDMATLLVYIATDAIIGQAELQQLLELSVNKSFNRITVDSDTSTNDSCMLVATGKSGATIVPDSSDYKEYAALLTELCVELAQGIIKDAEGATKFIEIKVVNGHSKESCLDVAYSVANSPLVKSALFACDANWGRIVMAIGKSKAKVNANRTDITIGDVCLMKQGTRSPDYSEAQGATVMAKEEIVITIDLNEGDACDTVWTSDLSYEYVRINAEYRT